MNINFWDQYRRSIAPTFNKKLLSKREALSLPEGEIVSILWPIDEQQQLHQIVHQKLLGLKPRPFRAALHFIC